MITALVPAHDEADLIGSTVDALRTIKGIDRIVVVDDHSSDDTVGQARLAGAEVLSLTSNLGKGGALQTGIDHLCGSADIVMFIDADLGGSAQEAALLLEPIVRGEADMSIAAFPKPQKKAGFGLVMGLARFGIRALGGPFDATAPLSGQRALNASALHAVQPLASGYGVEVAMTIWALRAGLRLIEIPTRMTHAATGRDLKGFTHRGRQFVHVATALVRLAVQHRDERPQGERSP